MSNPALDAALEYAALGWPVFPCSPVTKQPMTEHGFKDAATDPQVISAWWRKNPNAMIGMATGAASGVVVLDIDVDPEKGLDGMASLRAIPGAEIPEGAMCVRTPRGGLHVWFQAPPEGIRNSAGRLGPGLDVRGDGGYVIVPPSVNGAGIAYKWDPWGALFPMEDWLRPKPKAAPPHQQYRPRTNGDDRGTSYGGKALEEECRIVATTPEGRRNEQLFRSSAKLFELVAGDVLGDGEVRDALIEAAIAAGLSAIEAGRTIDSAAGHGLQNPRWPNKHKGDSRYSDYGADPREGWNELPKWEGDPEPGENARPIGTKSSKPSAKTGIELFNFREYRTQFKSSEQSAIDGLCRFGTVLGVSSRPSWGKTALLIHMSQCLSSGTAFLGRETAQCSIAYLATEDIEDVVNRMEAVGDDKLLVVKSPEGLPLTKPKRAKEIVLEVIRQARERNPDRSVFVVVDTFRAAMGEQSVIDDRYASPALNALREVAEQEKVLIGIANHTNRENTKQTKGETLEAVAATELILVQGDGDWYNIFVGKNRSGPGHKQIGRVRYTSVEVGDVHAAIVEEIVADEPYAHQKSDNRKYGANQRLVMRIVGNLVVDAEPYYPYGAEGPCVKAVREAAAREEFVSRRAGEERNPKVKAFTATLQSLLDKGDLARGENSKAEGMLWFGIREAENSARHEGIDGG